MVPSRSVENRWRARCLVVAAALVIALAGPVGATPGAAAQSGEVAAVDLAALLPGILDLEAVGLNGMLGAGANEFDSASAYATGFGSAEDASGLLALLDDAGFVRQYESYWFNDAADQGIEPGVDFVPLTRIRFYAAQYASADGAAAGFSAIESGDTDIDATGVDLGDRSEVSEATNVKGGVKLAGVDVTVQLGTLNLGVTVQTQADSPVHGNELNLATALAGPFVERVGSLGALPTAGIGLDTLRFAAPSLDTIVNGYLIRDGRSILAFSGDTPAEREASTQAAVERGNVSEYQVYATLNPETGADADADADAGTAYNLNSRTLAYASEELARAGFGQITAGFETAYTVTALDGAPSVGDESVAVAAVSANGSVFLSAMMWRDGATIRSVILEVVGRQPSPDALFAMVDAQVGCLASGTCWQFQDLPAVILDDASPPVDGEAGPTGTPAAGQGDAPPEPVAQLAASGSATRGV